MGVQERLTLQAVGAATLIAVEHIHRYELAAALCSGRRVLDLCCGSGYGAAILATTARSVHGVDSDAATVDLAANMPGLARSITFELADATAFLRQDLRERFDAIVCFEGLEHLPDLEATLRELRRHALAGVAVIASVPNSRGLGERNEFHHTEFGYPEALDAFRPFPEAMIIHQYLAEGSLIVAEEAGDLDARLHGLERAEPQYANHFLLVSAIPRERVVAAHRARLQLAVAPNHNRYMQSLERANTELRRRNNQLSRGLLGKGDSAAPSYVKRTERQREELARCEAEVRELRRELDHRQRKIRRLEEQIEDGARVAPAPSAGPPSTPAGPAGGLVDRMRRRLLG